MGNISVLTWVVFFLKKNYFDVEEVAKGAMPHPCNKMLDYNSTKKPF